jgi:hypothetical protein
VIVAEVLAPATTPTNGIVWGGLKGWPMTERSRCLQADCTMLILSPDELGAIIASGGVAGSISAKSWILKSWRSDPFSWTKSVSASACCKSTVNSR